MTLAVSALQRGAALADAKSLRCLGKLYRDGVGVPCDADKANEYFLRAARLFEEDGESDSLFHLAVRARKWLIFFFFFFLVSP